MRLKIVLATNSLSPRKEPITCLGWSGSEEVYTAGDDTQLYSWSVTDVQPTKIAHFPDFYPTDMQFLPKIGGGLSKHAELILLTTVDGKFHIINRTGRIERTVEGHKGAILIGQWGNDGGGILTAGEDGCLKIWSRSGMLRSTVVTCDRSIYAACWSPDSQTITYGQGKCIVIKPLAPNTKPLKWKAHEGLILCLAWSSTNDLIASGGEDCRYKVWNPQGYQFYSSVIHDNHITSIAWSPNGDVFAIGSYNTLRLCDYTGWSRCLEKPVSGSIYKLAWSNDGTQLAGACANGHLLIAHIVERYIDYGNYTATITEPKIIQVRDIKNDSTETLELSERIIFFMLRYEHLVATTPSQCYIYSTTNWNTPAIFDLKDGAVNVLELCRENLLLAEKSSVGIYNYQGRLIGSPRWPNMRLDTLKRGQISLAPDVLAVIDAGDPKVIHIVDLTGNRSSTQIQHTESIFEIALNQWGSVNSRNLAVLDRNKDLYLVSRNTNEFKRLGKKVDSFRWNSEENIVGAIQGTQLVVWYCPTACFDPNLFKMCSFIYDSVEIGKSPRISDFVGNSISVRRADGSLIEIAISPYPLLLHKYLEDNRWTNALDLCRTTNDQTLWACLAVLSTQTENTDVIEIAEEAFSNINLYEKVYYIQYIKSLSNKVQKKAGLALLGGALQEAESILLHNSMVFQAIYNNIQLYNWDRALDLALKHKTHIDTVIYLRQQYLDRLGKNENNNKFNALKETIQIDPDKVQLKIENELKK